MKLKKPAIASLLAAVITVTLVSSCETPVEAPQQSISPREANVLEEEYKSTRYRIINEALDIEDTRDFWFSLDSLKQYIKYVEQQSADMGKKNLGLRVYFAAYPENSNIGDPGFSTVFFVPTFREDASDLQKGLLPIQPPNQNNDSLNAFNYGGGGFPPNDYNN